jgi:hypothetical protein
MTEGTGILIFFIDYASVTFSFRNSPFVSLSPTSGREKRLFFLFI